MAISDLFLLLAVLSVLWGIVSSAFIVSFLSRRGVKINWLFMRILVLRYIHQYHRITRDESGEPGPWYYSYIVAMNLALICTIVGLAMR
jgi:hypothetical protein